MLTKEQAIQGHRDMWNWIAEQKENGSIYTVSHLKYEWCENHNIKLYNNCFCCEYATQEVLGHPIEKVEEEPIIYDCNFCKCCPIIWGTEENVKSFYCESGLNFTAQVRGSKIVVLKNTGLGLWSIANKYTNEIECAKICRQIANLEVKEDA